METTQTILEGDSGQPPEQVQPLRPTQLAKENSQSRSNRLDPMPSDSDKIAGTEQHNAQEAQPPTLSADGPEGKTTQDGGNDNSESNEPYSLFTDTEKRFAIMIASFAALISPLAGSTYYPSLNSLADNYGVSISDITLSITIFQVKISRVGEESGADVLSRSFKVLHHRSLATSRTELVDDQRTSSASLRSWAQTLDWRSKTVTPP